jgi:hypothetical protein
MLGSPSSQDVRAHPTISNTFDNLFSDIYQHTGGGAGRETFSGDFGSGRGTISETSSRSLAPKGVDKADGGVQGRDHRRQEGRRAREQGQGAPTFGSQPPTAT